MLIAALFEERQPQNNDLNSREHRLNDKKIHCHFIPTNCVDISVRIWQLCTVY